MYIQASLARDRHQEHLRQAKEERAARQIAELRKLEKRQRRAEREMLHAWELVERLRNAIFKGNRKLLDKLILEVGETGDPRLAPALKELADNYEYDAMTRLLEGVCQ